MAYFITFHMLVIKKVKNSFLSKIGSDIILINRVNLGICQIDESFSITSYPTYKRNKYVSELKPL